MQADESGFSDQYLELDQSGLLELAREYDSLTDDAQAALRAEFARRGMEAPLVEEVDEPEQRRLVTVRQYRDTSEAIVARSLLESAGIVVYLQDENLVRLDWQISNFIGGIRLQVDAADEAAATELLAQPIPESIEFDGGEEFLQPHCPKCGSVDVRDESAHWKSALATTMLFAIPTPAGRSIEVCGNCGARWEDTRPNPEASSE